MYVITLIFFLSSFTVLANPLNFEGFLRESKKIRKEIMVEKSFEVKKKKLKSFETLFNDSLRQYKELNPEEGSADEDRVIKFYYSFEPVFELLAAEISKENCKKVSHKISLEDRDAGDVNSKLSVGAEEAIQVLKTICPK